jgi:hypothetical protein
MATMMPGTALGPLQATRKRVFGASAAHWLSFPRRRRSLRKRKKKRLPDALIPLKVT